MSKRYSKRWNKFPLFSFSIIMSMVTLGSLIHPLPPEQKKAIRDLEKVSMKLCKSECSVLFNSLCVKEKLLPNYSNINLHDEAAKREPFTLKYRQLLVQRELDNAKAKMSSLGRDQTERIASLRTTMDKNILEPILTTIENNVNNLETENKLKMSSYTLTEHDCHLQSSVNKYDRKVELEI